ncbi:xanthine dehydrogenase small subunit [Limibaculum sp. FT325]|uniref:xanthine dehydrogenase small subunit n=1 Tax=Thermohalobaculum sediminis TaxID=2939436 RepID=UPI0020BFEC43|nr:xanthine dehydrogenase small subunit [Limibaculum sediminis]MCL5777294.1 xanthine dehydrogenase small subunit [Limibaculum sediminis]
MPGAIRFILNGAMQSVADAAPTTTLLDWLRAQGLTGTKEGCAEGDCGACTVGLREIGPDGRLATRPVCACIQLLPMVHGREVVTVERLAAPDGRLHPVQLAMAEGHGAQCGFCTPGIVMSLWCAWHTEGPPSPERADALLAGNLCRCTGYGPIVAAARAAHDLPRPDWDNADAAAAPARLGALSAGPLDYAAQGRRFLAPDTLDALAALAARHPEATILSGATDVGLWVTKRDFDPATIVWTGRVAALREIREEPGALVLGAGATYAEAHVRLAALWPDLGRLIARIGGAQVRAMGTIGGNIANGSPIGDMPPALIALGARLILRRGDGQREIALEDFFLDYGKQDRAPGEIVEAVRVPTGGPALSCHKVSKRFDQDITAVLGCFVIGIEGGRVTHARLAYGGMAGIPKRARAAETALLGQPYTRETVEAAIAALARDFTPLTDMRASAAYRLKVAQNLLMRDFLERTRPDLATRLAPEPV